MLKWIRARPAIKNRKCQFFRILCISMGKRERTFDVSVYVLRSEGGHERRTLGGERGVCLFNPERGVVYEKLLLDRL